MGAVDFRSKVRSFAHSSAYDNYDRWVRANSKLEELIEFSIQTKTACKTASKPARSKKQKENK